MILALGKYVYFLSRQLFSMPNGSKLVGANYFTMGRTRRGEVNFAFISAILVLSIIAAGWFASRWGSSKGANDSQNTAAQPLDLKRSTLR